MWKALGILAASDPTAPDFLAVMCVTGFGLVIPWGVNESAVRLSVADGGSQTSVHSCKCRRYFHYDPTVTAMLCCLLQESLVANATSRTATLTARLLCYCCLQ